MSQQNHRHAPLGFYHLAEDFYRSAKLTAEANEKRSVLLHYGHVPYHLHTHSIELALKAFLRTRQVGLNDLSKSFRHDLMKALIKCEELRLKCRKPKRTREVVGMLNELART